MPDTGAFGAGSEQQGNCPCAGYQPRDSQTSGMSYFVQAQLELAGGSGVIRRRTPDIAGECKPLTA